jgi:hypothetical protein
VKSRGRGRKRGTARERVEKEKKVRNRDRRSKGGGMSYPGLPLDPSPDDLSCDLRSALLVAPVFPPPPVPLPLPLPLSRALIERSLGDSNPERG